MMKHWWIIVWLILFFGGDGFASNSFILNQNPPHPHFLQNDLILISEIKNLERNEWDEVYQQNLIRKEKYDLATLIHQKLGFEKPSHPRQFQESMVLGKSYFYKHDLEHAMETFSKARALALNPQEESQALYWMGKTAFEIHNYTDASNYFSISIMTSTDPIQDEKTYFWVGLSAFLLGEYEYAITAFENIQHNDHLKVVTKYFIGRCYFALNQYKQGIHYLKELSENETTNILVSEMEFLIGRSYLELDNPQQAMFAFNRALVNDEHFVADSAVSTGDPPQVIYQGTVQNQNFVWWIDEGLYLLGWSYYLLEEYDAAHQTFQLLWQLMPESPYIASSYFIDGHIYQIQGDYLQALDQYRQIARLYTQHDLMDDTLFRIGWCYYQLQDYSNALTTFQWLLTDFPYSGFEADARYFTGESFYELEAYEQARQMYEMLQNDKTAKKYLPHSIHGMAWSYYRQENFEQASKYFENLISIAPTNFLNANGMYWGAMSYQRIRDYESAVQLFDQYLENTENQEQDRDEAQYNLAYSLSQLGRVEAARMAYQNVVEDYPQSRLAPYAQSEVASIYYQQEDYQNAIKAYQEIEKWNEPQNLIDTARYQIEWCYHKLKGYFSPIQVPKNFIRKYPNSPKSASLQLEIGDYYFRIGYYQSAIREYRKVIQNYPDQPEVFDAYFGIGNCYYQRNLYEQAIQEYQKLLSQEIPPSVGARVQYVMAETYRTIGDYSQAITEYQLVVTDYPKNELAVDAMFNIGVIYQKNMKQWSEARTAYKDLIQRYPKSEQIYEAYLNIAKTYYQESNFEQTRMIAHKVIEGASTEFVVEALFLLAGSYFNQGNWQNAFDYYTQIYDDYQQYTDWSTRAMYQAGLCLEELNRVQEAITLYEKIIEQTLPINAHRAEKARQRLEIIRKKP